MVPLALQGHADLKRAAPQWQFSALELPKESARPLIVLCGPVSYELSPVIKTLSGP